MLDKNLKNKRAEKGYSQAKLAKLSDVSRNTINFIENGKVKTPMLDTLKSLANALDTTIEELIK